MRRGVKRPRSRASNGAIAASRSTVISNGEVMDVYDPIWDDVCCSCNNQNVTLADRSLKVAPCGHKFCTTCENRLFSKGRRSACRVKGCPQVALKRSDLSTKSLEQQEYELERSVRARLAKVFNKTLQSFGNDEQKFNNYLEKVEMFIMVLTEGTEAEKAAAERAIATYKAENQRDIQREQSKRTAAIRLKQAQLAAEKERAKQSVVAAEKREAKLKEIRSRERDAVTKVVMGEASAEDVILQTNIDAVTGLDDLDQNPFGAAHFALPRPVNGATKLRMRRLPPVGSEARKVQRAASGYRAASQRTRDWQAAFATLLGPGPPAVHVLPSAASTSCATTTGTGAGGGAGAGAGAGSDATPAVSAAAAASFMQSIMAATQAQSAAAATATQSSSSSSTMTVT